MRAAQHVILTEPRRRKDAICLQSARCSSECQNTINRRPPRSPSRVEYFAFLVPFCWKYDVFEPRILKRESKVIRIGSTSSGGRYLPSVLAARGGVRGQRSGDLELRIEMEQ